MEFIVALSMIFVLVLYFALSIYDWYTTMHPPMPDNEPEQERLEEV